MGLALIVPGISFASKNLGQVTPLGYEPITGLAISGPDTVTGSAVFTPIYTPANTSQRGVAWSIVSGGTYASINASTGEVTALSGASASPVTIRVTSTEDASIYAEKTISVSAGTGPTIMSTITFDGQSAIDTGINASMPTEIKVWIAKSRPSLWALVGSDVRSATIVGGRVSSSEKRRDLQISSLVSNLNVVGSVVFGVGSTSVNFDGMDIPKDDEIYIAQSPTYYQAQSQIQQRTAQDTFDSSVHYVIGCQNNNGILNFNYASFESFIRVQIFATAGGEMVRDLVPAISGGIHGMYDQVSGQFFTNVGTGTLICE